VLRCLEEARGTWVIVTGDDDPPLPNYVEDLRRRALEYPQAVCLSYGAPVIRKQLYETRGRLELLQKMDSLGSFTFLSSNLYRREKVLPALRWGYTVPAFCPHVTVLIMAVQDGDQVVALPEALVRQPDPSGWPVLLYSHYVGGLLDLPLTLEERRALARVMLQWPNYSLIFNMLADDEKMSVEEKLYHFDHIVFKRLSLCGTWREGAKMLGYRCLLKWPWLLALLPRFKRLLGRGKPPLRDRDPDTLNTSKLERL